MDPYLSPGEKIQQVFPDFFVVEFPKKHQSACNEPSKQVVERTVYPALTKDE